MTADGGFDRLDRCFACSDVRMVPVGPFRYPAEQGGFIPDEWLVRYRAPELLVRCPRCGSQGPATRPNAAVLADWYGRQTYAASEVLSEGHLHAAKLVDQLKPRTLVDVGTGSGSFLGAVGAGVRAFGIEPSLEAARQGAARGRRIFVPDESGWSAELPERVDVITLFDVIEHIREPSAFLEVLARRLNPGGRLLIFTGDAGSIWAKLWNLRWWYHGWAGHLSCFSAAGLGGLLRRVGFELTGLDPLPYARVTLSARQRLEGGLLLLGAQSGLLRTVDALSPPTATCPLGIDHVLVTARLPA